MYTTLTLLVSVASATTFAEVPNIERLTDDSKAIVQGEVLVSETKPCSVGLCTKHTVLVHETLKGQPQETVEVTVPGGRLNGLTQRAAGVPLWEEGSKVILFVSDAGTVPLTGLLTLEAGRPVDPLYRRLPAHTVPELKGFVLKRQLVQP